MAAKQQEWEIAIRSFQEARKTAPDAPEVFYNLGLAESKMPGRELRAIAWFGAYLSATRNAPNAAAVKDKIAELQIKNEGNTSRLINQVQEIALQLKVKKLDFGHLLEDVAGLWTKAGNFTAALSAANLIGSDLVVQTDSKHRAKEKVAIAQAAAGDITSALKTADLIEGLLEKSRA